MLTGADVVTVEMIAVLLEQFRRDPDEMETSRITRLATELKGIGLSPSGRASLQVEKPKKNRFEGL